jgi:hypothetical protein
MGFGETVAGRRTWFGCSKRAASEFENKPTLELSKTPALIDLCAGRITVDAREKD